MSIVFYTSVDAQNHKLVTVIGWTKLTKLVAVNSPEFGVSEGNILILVIPKIPLQGAPIKKTIP